MIDYIDPVLRNKQITFAKIKVALDDMSDKVGCPGSVRMEYIKALMTGLLYRLWNMESSQIIEFRKQVLNEQ